MLSTLNVKNFAIIDNISIDFSDGLTVITGETGAGKSLIIDAIGLLLGQRASNDLIRFGESKAVVEGVFTNYSKNITKILDDYGIEYSLEEDLIIKRELYLTGKNICRVNNQLLSLNQLKEIGNFIGDIHSQIDSIGLIYPKNYLSFLKNPTINNLFEKYSSSLSEYKNLYKTYNNLVNKNNEDIKRKDFLTFQLKELENASLNSTEEEELKQELKYLNNYENIIQNISELKEILEGKTLDDIYLCINILDKLSKIDEKYSLLKTQIEESYYNLDAVRSDNLLKAKLSEFDQSRYDNINNRLGLYSELKRKYKMTVSELNLYLENIKKDLNDIENYDDNIKILKEKLDSSYNETLQIAKELRNERQIMALALVSELKSTFTDLQLKNTEFEIRFNDISSNISFNNEGIDEIDFLVSFNKGEPLKPLSKVASGGELSRFMLSLKSILGSKLPMQTKIFDEIDSGVSGLVASSIGSKLKEISKTSQVLCITHLPQVASYGMNHLKISKVIENERTFTVIKNLNHDERVEEIASMISNGTATLASISLAKELLSTITNI